MQLLAHPTASYISFYTKASWAGPGPCCFPSTPTRAAGPCTRPCTRSAAVHAPPSPQVPDAESQQLCLGVALTLATLDYCLAAAGAWPATHAALCCLPGLYSAHITLTLTLPGLYWGPYWAVFHPYIAWGVFLPYCSPRVCCGAWQGRSLPPREGATASRALLMFLYACLCSPLCPSAPLQRAVRAWAAVPGAAGTCCTRCTLGAWPLRGPSAGRAPWSSSRYAVAAVADAAACFTASRTEQGRSLLHTPRARGQMIRPGWPGSVTTTPLHQWHAAVVRVTKLVAQVIFA